MIPEKREQHQRFNWNENVTSDYYTQNKAHKFRRQIVRKHKSTKDYDVLNASDDSKKHGNTNLFNKVKNLMIWPQNINHKHIIFCMIFLFNFHFH